MTASTVDELRRQLERLQLERLQLAHRLTCDAYGDLLAAAWAAVGAAETGAPDPLWQLRDELLTHPFVTAPGAGDPTQSSAFGPVPAPALAPRRTAA